jgi:drug/metabolite transporter (DMT)-like permease
MAKVLIILLVALIFEAVGVVYLIRGLREIGEVSEVNLGQIVGLVRRGVVNSNLLTGIALEAIFFGALLYLLSQRDLSLIWPLTSLGFLITALAGRWILQEEVSWVRWSGVILIVVGACLVGYSEVLKSKKPDTGEDPPTRASDPREVERGLKASEESAGPTPGLRRRSASDAGNG